MRARACMLTRKSGTKLAIRLSRAHELNLLLLHSDAYTFAHTHTLSRARAGEGERRSEERERERQRAPASERKRERARKSESYKHEAFDTAKLAYENENGMP